MTPLQDQLIRGCKPGPELRAAEDGGMPKLTGYPIVFDTYTTIHSYTEGHFREQVAAGSVTRTLKENKPKIIFNHGDSSIGDMPIAPSALIADERGVRYDEPELYDEPFTRGLVPRLRDGELGSSFKFNVTREKWDDEPEKSDQNPDGIPERTITEMRLFEVGPVVWPAYEDASAGVRSLTDEFRRYTFEEMQEFFERWLKDPERAERIGAALGVEIAKRAMMVEESDACPTDRPWAVMSGTEKQSCHASKAEAEATMEEMGPRSQEPDEKTGDRIPSDDGGSPSPTHSSSAETKKSHSGTRRALDTPISGTKPKRALEQSLKE